MMKKRMLITGVSGLLGYNLAEYFKDQYDVLGLYHTHPVTIKGVKTEQTDLTSSDQVGRQCNAFNPEVLIHCAALTNIDYCEAKQDETFKANVLATKNIVECVTNKKIKLVYISTDNVFDGEKGDYKEEDEVNPLNFYGQTKYQGELEVLKDNDAIIARTNIFGWNIQNKHCLSEWIVDELSQDREIKGFTDVFFSSIYTKELAKLLEEALKKDVKGIYHFASSTSISKYEFAVKLAELFNLNKDHIKPISVDEFDFKAKRGKNLSLSVSKLHDVLDKPVPSINDSLTCFHHERQVAVGMNNED